MPGRRASSAGDHDDDRQAEADRAVLKQGPDRIEQVGTRTTTATAIAAAASSRPTPAIRRTR